MKKDFDDYFAQVEAQYVDCVNELHDMEKEMANDLVSPEMYQQFQDTVRPLKTNYDTLSYVKFLLDIPNKKDKVPRYRAQNQKLLRGAKTRDQVVAENDAILKELKGYTEDGE